MPFVPVAEEKPKPAGGRFVPVDESRERAQAPAPTARGMTNMRTGLPQADPDIRGGAATTARLVGGVIGNAGGPVGIASSGAGEQVAQWIEGRDDPRAKAQSMAAGGIPFGRLGRVAAPVVAGGVNYATGKLADIFLGKDEAGPSTEKQAAMTAAITAAMPILGKAIGALTGHASAEELARVAGARSRNAPRDAAYAGGAARGMAVPPTANNDTWLNRRLEGFAGGARTARQAGVNNNVAGGNAIREDINLPANATLDDGVIERLRHEGAAPYRATGALSDNGGIRMYHDGSGRGGFLTSDPSAVRAGAGDTAQFHPRNPITVQSLPENGAGVAHGPTRQQFLDDAFANGHDAVIVDNGSGRIDAFVPRQPSRESVIYRNSPIGTAADDLEVWKNSNADEAGFLKKDRAPEGYHPSNRVKAEEAGARADAARERMQLAGSRAGQPELSAALDDSRVYLAKVSDVKKSLGASGEIDLNKIGGLVRKDGRTGNIEAVGDFANTYGGKFTRPTASMPNPSSSALEAPAILGAGLIGGAKKAAIVTANALARDPMRAFLLSRAGQAMLARPNYAPRTSSNPRVEAILQRLAALQGAQE